MKTIAPFSSISCRLIGALAVLSLYFSIIVPLHAENGRIALIVVNSKYQSDPLTNSVGELDQLSNSLTNAGFSVARLVNAPYYKLKSTIDRFEVDAADADAAVFLYSGHSLQLSDSAYLVPVDISLRSRADIRKLIDLQEIVTASGKSRSAAVILDACWKSTLAEGWGNTFDRTPLCAKQLDRLRKPETLLLTSSRSEAITPSEVLSSDRSYFALLAESVTRSDSFGEAVFDAHERTRRGDKPVIFSRASSNIDFADVDVSVTQTEDVSGGFSAIKRPDSVQSASGVKLTESVVERISGQIVSLKSTRVGSHLQSIQVGSTSIPALGSSGVENANWMAEMVQTDLFVFKNLADQSYLTDADVQGVLTLSALPNQSSIWRVSEVQFGSPGEVTLQNNASSRYLQSKHSGVLLGPSGTASSSGWVFAITSQQPPSDRNQLLSELSAFGTTTESIDPNRTASATGVVNDALVESGVRGEGGVDGGTDSELTQVIFLTSPIDAQIELISENSTRPSQARYVEFPNAAERWSVLKNKPYTLIVQGEGYQPFRRTVQVGDAGNLFKVSLFRQSDDGLNSTIPTKSGILETLSGVAWNDSEIIGGFSKHKSFAYFITHKDIKNLETLVNPGFSTDLLQHLFIAYETILFYHEGISIHEVHDAMTSRFTLKPLSLTEGNPQFAARPLRELVVISRMDDSGQWSKLQIVPCSQADICIDLNQYLVEMEGRSVE